VHSDEKLKRRGRKPIKGALGRIAFERARPIDRIAARVTKWRRTKAKKERKREVVPPAPRKIGGFVIYRDRRIELTPLYSYQITRIGHEGDRKYRRTYGGAIKMIDGHE
jgi:hypothetical protein